MYYGIPPEPDLGVVIEEENEDEDDKDKPKVTLSSSLQSYQTKNHKFCVFTIVCNIFTVCSDVGIK